MLSTPLRASLLLTITCSWFAAAQSPWKSPCGDQRHAAPSHVRTQFNQWIGSKSVAKASREELRYLASDIVHKINTIVYMVDFLKRHLSTYFRGNNAHIQHLERLPNIQAIIPSKILQNADIETTLTQIYEIFTRIVIFTKRMKNQLADIQNVHEKAERLSQLRVIENGGSWQGIVVTSGIYNIMCDIYRVLPNVLNDLEDDIVPESMYSSATVAAMRHNRDYYVLHNIERVLLIVMNKLRRFSQ